MNGWDLHFLLLSELLLLQAHRCLVWFLNFRHPPHLRPSLRTFPFPLSSAVLSSGVHKPQSHCCLRQPSGTQRAFVRIRFVELFKNNTTNSEHDSVSFVNHRSHRRQRLPDTHTQELRISPFAVLNELQFEYPSTRMELPLAAANRFVFEVGLTTSFLRIDQTPLASPEPTATSTISCTRSTTPTSLISSLRQWPQGIDFLYQPILFASLSSLRHMCVFLFRILPEPVMTVFVHFTGWITSIAEHCCESATWWNKPRRCEWFLLIPSRWSHPNSCESIASLSMHVIACIASLWCLWVAILPSCWSTWILLCSPCGPTQSWWFCISCPASVPQRFRPSVLLLCLLLERLLISSLISLVLRSGILQLCIHHFTTAFLDTPNRSTFPASFLTGLHPCSCPSPWSLSWHVPSNFVDIFRFLFVPSTITLRCGRPAVPTSSLCPPWVCLAFLAACDISRLEGLMVVADVVQAEQHLLLRLWTGFWQRRRLSNIFFDRADILHKSGIFTPPLSLRSILLHQCVIDSANWCTSASPVGSVRLNCIVNICPYVLLLQFAWRLFHFSISSNPATLSTPVRVPWTGVSCQMDVQFLDGLPALLLFFILTNTASWRISPKFLSFVSSQPIRDSMSEALFLFQELRSSSHVWKEKELQVADATESCRNYRAHCTSNKSDARSLQIDQVLQWNLTRHTWKN